MRLMYRFALLVSLIALIGCLIGGISVITSLYRAGVVFIGVLFAFFIAGQLFQLGMFVTRENSTDKKAS